MAIVPDRRKIATFISTKEHRRFIEFADAVRKHCFIGLCHGAAGVGKTLSARRYAHWDMAEPLLHSWGARQDSDMRVYAALARARTVFYTPTVGSSLRELRWDLPELLWRVDVCIDEYSSQSARNNYPFPHHYNAKLIIIDESERLSTTNIEYIRDLFDRQEIGLIFIGMPGIEKRMSRYPQLYSRVGFVHHYRQLQEDDLITVMNRRWRTICRSTGTSENIDAQVGANIARITGGNFRLIQQIFFQIERILLINGISTIDDDVIEAACSALVINAH